MTTDVERESRACFLWLWLVEGWEVQVATSSLNSELALPFYSTIPYDRKCSKGIESVCVRGAFIKLVVRANGAWHGMLVQQERAVILSQYTTWCCSATIRAFLPNLTHWWFYYGPQFWPTGEQTFCINLGNEDLWNLKQAYYNKAVGNPHNVHSFYMVSHARFLEHVQG